MRAQAGSARHGERRSLDEPAAVRFTPSGSPLALRWHGSIWQVVGTPVPGTPSSVLPEHPRPTRAHSVTGGTSAWRFPAQTGPASPILEFGIVLDVGREEWRLVSVRGTTD